MRTRSLIGLALLSFAVPSLGQQTNVAEGEAVSADGVRIVYEVRGRTNDQPTLVFVHGWCGCRSCWSGQLNSLASNHFVVALDLGGHGASGTNRVAWTMKAFGEDVKAVVEQLKLPKVILIGHSMGGPVIVEAARLMPDRVSGLVGVDTFHNIESRPSKDEIDQALVPMRKDFIGHMAAFVRRNLFTTNADPALVTRVMLKMTAEPPRIALGAFEEVLKEDLATAIAGVHAPIRCINSDLRPTDIKAARRHCKSFEVTLMPGTGHFLMMEQPEKFNELLEKVVGEFGTR